MTSIDELTNEEQEAHGFSEGTKKSLQEKTVVFIKNNPVSLLIGLGIFLLIGAGVYFWIQNRESTAKEAVLALYRITPYLDSTNLNVALEGSNSVRFKEGKLLGLKEIANRYDGYESGITASLYAGNALVSQGKYEEAEIFYEKAQKASSSSVKLGGFAGGAVCKEHSKNFSEAAKLYEQASNLSTQTPAEVRFKLYLARCLEKSSEKEKAVQVYQDIVAGFESTEYASEAKASLSRLGTVVD